MAPHTPDAETILGRFSEPTRTWFNGAFPQPTAAQLGAWDSISQSNHTLVIAPTGSGKTLSAFLWSLDQLLHGKQPPAADEKPQGTEIDGTEKPSAEKRGKKKRTRVLYISPLKALGTDVERNLRAPLIGITQTARNLNQAADANATPDATTPEILTPDITVGIRTGDTPANQRRKLISNPPDILITTPESLYLMLTSKARETLSNIDTVIIDEVHALASTKRGAHLAVSLERLDNLLAKPAQRVGLSATVEPHEEVARFLGGNQPVTIVAPPSEKTWDLRVTVPVPDLADLATAPAPQTGLPTDVASASIWPHIEERVLSLIRAHRSTIVFVNSRRLAEKLTTALNELNTRHENERTGTETAVPDIVMAHHGSVSKERRAAIEESLKTGALTCVVATSSLELGIDMGDVDLVIQIESPGAVSAGLQRVGRAGHHVGAESHGHFFPKHRNDLVSTTITVQRMHEGLIETMAIPANPLDVLAQHTVAAAALDTLDVETWYDTLRRSAPYASLPHSAYIAVLDLLAGKYPSADFAELRPRIIWDRDEGTITARPGAQRLAVTSGGTIPDRGLFGVFLADGDQAGTGNKRVGELDEEMVYETRIGEVIQLGASAWRIEDITFDRVLVTPAAGEPGKLPFWHGDDLSRPAELGQALGAFQARIAHQPETETHAELIETGLDEWAATNLIRYIKDQQQATGRVPSDTHLVIERFKDELGDWRLVLHSPWGKAVHAPWALAVSARIEERYGLDGSAMAADDGIVVRLPLAEDEPPGAEIFIFEPDELEDIVTERVGGSALFAARFRECAARALLLPRRDPGRRTPLWQQRQRAAQLLAVAAKHPTFPIVMETVREVLQDVYDMPALRVLTEKLASRAVRITEVETREPSPFAQSLLFGYLAQFLYEGDSPLAERRAAALSLEPKLLNEILGRGELRELLDADIIAAVEAEAQRLAPSRRAWGLEGAADLLRVLGPLNAEELAARLNPPDGQDNDGGASGAGAHDAGASAAPHVAAPHASVEDAAAWADELVAQRRALKVRIRGAEVYAAIEDAARLRDALGIPLPMGVPVAFLEPVEAPLEDLVLRYARTHGPFTTEQAAHSLGLANAVVIQTLRRLMQDNRIECGEFTPGRTGGEWCDTEILRRIRARTLAALRSEVEPTPQDAYARFLLDWQDVGTGAGRGTQASHSADALRGLDGVYTVIEQLAGVPLPASAWESYVFPARVTDYAPAMLEELLASGDVVFSGAGALAADDGWIAFHTTDTAALSLPLAMPDAVVANSADSKSPAGATNPGDATSTDDAAVHSTLHERVLGVLGSGGAFYVGQIAQALAADGADPGATPVTDSVVGSVLWDLLWSGRVTNDSFLPVRSLLTQGKATHQSRSRARTTRVGRAGLRGLRSAVASKPAVLSPAERLNAGRWAALPAPETDPTLLAAARAEMLLARYGVVTKGGASVEGASFGTLYKIFQRREETGTVRRGYFVEKLGAAQFALSGTVDRLREFVRDDDAATAAPSATFATGTPAYTAVTLAATDPANPFGGVLPWPDPPAKARPGRKAGALVVMVDGHTALYVERGGRTVISWIDELAHHLTTASGAVPASASAADVQSALTSIVAVSLVEALRRARSQVITLQKVNGEDILGTNLAAALLGAGFSSLPSGVRFRPDF
ncbi:DEAD/DEAH box helicase [Pseudoglutamicibacter cumminsii]|uniref:DEAD/DEAH box helicase n=1 Tax=Pseudoglutamicibacter cumminsii TaxID=156979 RepID=A0AAP4FII8_9MICC|nr:DEAD/DEAH box helicase [Pseudoglutamicibacter cumminsii]MDK6275430.1 DEAD/DEAH box helicase [Pseudoglutamicibacter cumminsii]